MALLGLPGGANVALTTTETVIDLSALANEDVVIWCDEQDVFFCFTLAAEVSTTLITTALAASKTALIADRIGAGVKVKRHIAPGVTRLLAKTVTSTGTLRIKKV